MKRSGGDRCGRGPIHFPVFGEESVEILGRVRRKPLQDIPQVSKWIDPVSFAGGHEAVEDGGPFTSGITALEEVVSSAKDYRAQSAFGRLSSMLKITVLEVSD